MILNMAIVDDVHIDAQRIDAMTRSFFAGNTEYEPHISLYDSGESFLADPAGKDCFLVFLDILMNDLNGIDVARRIRRHSMNCLIVFTTSSSEYVWDAVAYHPFDYLLKPCREEKVRHVLSEALRTLHEGQQTIEVRIAYGSVTLLPSRISYVIARDHSLEITTTAGEQIKSLMTFSQILEMLDHDPRFMVCNRGVLLNMDEVTQFANNCFHLRDGACFPVRQRDRAALVRQFQARQLDRI